MIRDATRENIGRLAAAAFASTDQAEAALQALVDAGFTQDQIGVIGSPGEEHLLHEWMQDAEEARGDPAGTLGSPVDLVRDAGRYDGTIDGAFVWGKSKLEAVRRWAADHDVDLDESFAYSDSYYDNPLLSGVGRPVAVNPDPGRGMLSSIWAGLAALGDPGRPVAEAVVRIAGADDEARADDEPRSPTRSRTRLSR